MGLFKLFAVSAVVMCISHSIAKERIGEPIRRRLGGKERWLGYLMSCPYCLSHWVAFVLVPLTGAYYLQVAPRWGVVSSLLDWLLSSILVVVIAAFLRVVFYFVDQTQGLVRKQQKRVDVEVERIAESETETETGTETGVEPQARPRAVNVAEQPLPNH